MICSPYFLRDALSLPYLNEQNTMNRMKHLICVFLLAAFGSCSFKANAYTERDMLVRRLDRTIPAKAPNRMENSVAGTVTRRLFL